jgi:hypothetical protein
MSLSKGSLISLGLATSVCFAIPSGEELPPINEKTSLIIQKYKPSFLSLPPTAYPIPDSSFILFDQRKVEGITITGALLGPAGVLLQGQAGKSETSKAIEGQAPKLFALDALAEQVLQKSVVENSKFSVAPSAGSKPIPSFTLTPFAWLNLVNDTDAKVSIVIEAKYTNAAESETWRNQYIFHSPIIKPISGQKSWFENDNEALRTISETGLKRTIAVFLKEINQSQFPDMKEVKITKCLLGTRKLTLLEHDKDTMVVKAQYNRGTGSYTYIVDATECPIEQ